MVCFGSILPMCQVKKKKSILLNANLWSYIKIKIIQYNLNISTLSK